MKNRKVRESFEKIKPSDEMKNKMLRNVLKSAQTEKNSNLWHSVGKEFFMKKAVIATVIAICILAVSGSTYAAYRWLNAREAVSEIGYEKLSKYFDIDRDVIRVQENDKYRASFLGIVSGENINDQILDEDIDKKLTYIVTAVERKDGKDMTDDKIVVSPFISGIRPMDFSIYSIHGGASMLRKDGVLYVLTRCDDLEIFADRDVYLAVMDGANMGEGYNYDEKTGTIERNKDFDRLNLLFELDLDKSKADLEKAQKYIDEILKGTSSETKIQEETERMAEYATKGLDKNGYNDLKNPEEIINQAKLMKGSEKKLTPDKNGIIKYVFQDVDLGTSAEYVKKNGIDTVLFYGEGSDDDEILVYTYKNGEYIGRLYTCNQSITRKSENKKYSRKE